MVRAWFQEHRIHGRFRRGASGLRLQVLSTPNLCAIATDAGIVRHVLRLEWRDCNASPRQCAAHSGDDE